MAWIDEWEGSEEELVAIAEESIFNYSTDTQINETAEVLTKLYLDALSHSDIQAAIHEKMTKIYTAYRITTSPRLTERNENGTAYFIKCFDGNSCSDTDCDIENCAMLDMVCEKLAYFEDAEEEKMYGKC